MYVIPPVNSSVVALPVLSDRMLFDHCFSTLVLFSVAFVKSISPNWSLALSNTPSAGLFPEPNLLLLVGPSCAGITAALNPLSPFPGIAWPLRGSWFLFTFSSSLTSALGLASGVSLGSTLTFGILSSTKALFFKATVALSTSPCVATSLASKAWALANSAFPSSIADAVFSVTATFAIAFWTRAIAALRLALFAFATVGAGVSSLAGVVTAVSLAGSLALFIAVSLLAKALPPPKNANPAATNTDAVPTLNFFIPYWLTFSSSFWLFILILFFPNMFASFSIFLWNFNKIIIIT